MFEDDDEEVNALALEESGALAAVPQSNRTLAQVDAQQVNGRVNTRLREEMFLVSWSTACSRQIGTNTTEKARKAMRLQERLWQW